VKISLTKSSQTGSGKTYTMGTAFDGDFKSDVGVIPRATLDIFKKIEQMKEHYEVTATCSFTELYQETLYDLLSGKPRDQSICDIREERSKGIYISGVTRKHIESPEETGDFLSLGSSGRAVGATAMNSVSSRSHAIFTIDIKTTKLDVEGESTNAKFHLVDLAGSERSKKTKATGERFKEGVKINQGLLALGNVISALGGGSGNGTGSYISYRDSKLTRLLQVSSPYLCTIKNSNKLFFFFCS
jgi:kinesin family protein 4/21/27